MGVGCMMLDARCNNAIECRVQSHTFVFSQGSTESLPTAGDWVRFFKKQVF
jgi:hypothetical protein